MEQIKIGGKDRSRICMYPISLPATNQVGGILSHKKDFLKIPKKILLYKIIKEKTQGFWPWV
jgi:hypothetical protein